MKHVLHVLVSRDIAITGVQVCSGPICTVLVLDVFGWTMFNVLAEKGTLGLVHTEAGALMTAVTQKMSR